MGLKWKKRLGLIEERDMAMNIFPTNKMLEDTVIEALQSLSGEVKVPEINAKVIDIL